MKSKDHKFEGPMSQVNWRAMQAHEPRLGWYESFLYTDVRVSGELTEGTGPFRILNALRLDASRSTTPTLVLRVEEYVDTEAAMNELGKADKTQTKHYTGGPEADELAALLSLAFGFRVMAGGRVRDGYTGDPLGRPRADAAGPSFYIAPQSARIVPRAAKQVVLECNPLVGYPELSPVNATALVRACRRRSRSA